MGIGRDRSQSRRVWLMAQRVSLIASVVTEETNGDAVQLILNKSTELSWHWLTGRRGRLSGYL